LTVVNVRSDRQDLTWTVAPGTVKQVILRGLAGPGSETSYTECCNGTSNTFIADHLTAGTSYCWQVENVNNLGERSAPSNEVCLSTSGVPVIPPPATVTATQISASRIRVDWSAVTNATKYTINQSEAGGPFVPVGAVLSPTLTFLKANLIAGTEYCYTIVVTTNDGTSPASSPPACATTIIAGLEGYWKFDEQTGTTASDSSGFGRTATLSGATFSKLDKAPIDDNRSVLDVPSTATAGANTAAVQAFRLTGAFSISFWANIPVAATDVKFMGMHNPGGCGAGAPGWEISQSAGGLAFISQSGTRSFGSSLATDQWTHVAVTYPGGANATMRLYLNGVEIANGPYTASNSLQLPMTFGHVGGCAGGQALLDEIQVFSRELTATEVATIGTVPQPPTNLTITKNNSTVQDLAWTAPAGGADHWVILRGVGPTAPGNEVPYTHAPNPPTTFNGDHLQPDTQYSWQVRTVKNRLLSNPSTEVVATTASAPAAPTGVTATAVSQTRINLAWNPVTNATKYYIFMSTAGGPFVAKGGIIAPTVTFQAANLTANTLYSFEVQAEDAGFTRSAVSAPASATTLP
jgi:titin